jgi:hypothetical protein
VLGSILWSIGAFAYSAFFFIERLCYITIMAVSSWQAKSLSVTASHSD